MTIKHKCVAISVAFIVSCVALAGATGLHVSSIGHQKSRIAMLHGSGKLPLGGTVPPGYPGVYRVGSIVMRKCLEDNPYGIDGIYCYNMSVRLNRDLHLDTRRIVVAFIVHVPLSHVGLAHSAHRSAVWYPLGGPGSVAHLSTNVFYGWAATQPRTWESSDIIMYDQRGMGWSCGMSCWNAFMKYVMASGGYVGNVGSMYADAPDFRRECEVEIASDATQSAASEACIVGSGLSPQWQRMAVLPFLGTRHAVADFEDFRIAAGYGRVKAVGTSYGTIAVQTYAGMFPRSVGALVIDSSFNQISSTSDSGVREAASRMRLLDRLAQICADDPECLNDVCPGTSAVCLDIKSGGSAAVLGVFESALDPANWPKGIDYPHVDVATGEYSVKHVDVPLDWFEFMVSAAMSRLDTRSALIRTLVAVGTGDASAAIHATFVALYYMDPTNPSFPVQYAMSSGSNQISSYPIVTGQDNVAHWKAVPFVTSSSNRQKQYVEAYVAAFSSRFGRNALSTPLGWSPLLFNQFVPVFSSPLPPVYSSAYQNHTLTPVVGWHGDFPVLLLNPSHDSNCPSEDSDILEAMYGSQAGATHRVTLIDGEHGVLLSEIDDPAMLEISAIVDNLLVDGTLPSGGNRTVVSLGRTKYDYRPRHVGQATLETVLEATENSLVMLPEWVSHVNAIASCDVSGFVYWQMYNASHETVAFSSCAFFGGDLVVDGVALYDWTTPGIHDNGANFVFPSAYVTNVATGDVKVYSYVHMSGLPAQQLDITLNILKSRSTSAVTTPFTVMDAMHNAFKF